MGVYLGSNKVGFNSLIQDLNYDEQLESNVIFFGKDGEILYTYTAQEFSALSALPTPPTYMGFTTDGWNWTLTDAKTQVSTLGYCDIGVIVYPSDEKTHIILELPEVMTTNFYVKGTQSAANCMIVDWGDGSAAESQSGTGAKTFSHIFSTAGRKEITVEVTSGNTVSVFLPYGERNVGTEYRKCIKAIYLGRRVTNFAAYALQSSSIEEITLSPDFTVSSTTGNGANAFQFCYGLKHINFPKSTTILPNSMINQVVNLKTLSMPLEMVTLGSAPFENSVNLRRVIFSKNVTSMGSIVFSSNRELVTLIIPNGLTSIPNSFYANMLKIKILNIPTGITEIPYRAFYYNIGLKELTLPNNITTLGNGSGGQSFYYALNLQKLTLPSSVTTIGTQMFQYCQSLKELHIKATTPPTLGTSPFSTGYNVNPELKIYVPSGTLATYQAADVWSSYASNMVEESS